jgi:hypothetical protein
MVRGDATSAPHLRGSARSILHITPEMPVILVVLACFLAGSLYTTALEGFVDWVHRALVLVNPHNQQRWVVRRTIGALAPLSASARGRLTVEATRFFREFGVTVAGDIPVPALHDFVDTVFADVLWMDGKLCGLPLRDLYAEYRSEGELRLGAALLLPLGACATGYAMRLDWRWLVLIGAVSVVVATKLASYGMYYYRRAHSLLAHHIADGGLLAPCMETLKRNRYHAAGAPGSTVFK